MTAVLRRRFPWERVVVLAVVLAASAAVLSLWGPDALKTTLSITGVGLTACFLWVVKSIRDWRLGLTDVDPSRLSSAAEQLGKAVHRMWQREAANRVALRHR